jgi:hypothetical protein
LPKTEDVVLASVDAINVMIILCFKLLGHGHNSLDALLVSKNVSLNSFVLLGRCFNGCQVKSKVILQLKI